MEKWHIEKRFSVGNGITILVIVASLITGYTKLETQSTQNAEMIRITQAEVSTFRGNYVSKEMYNIQDARLTRIEEKIDRLIQIQLSK